MFSDFGSFGQFNDFESCFIATEHSTLRDRIFCPFNGDDGIYSTSRYCFQVIEILSRVLAAPRYFSRGCLNGPFTLGIIILVYVLN